MNKLYRIESLKSNSQKLFGDVLLISPLSFWVLTISFTILVILMLLFLILATFAKKETVSGMLIPDKGLIRVFASYKGVVEKITVRDGMHVLKGDDLINISTKRGVYNGLSISNQLIDQLYTRKRQLRNKIKNESLVYENEKNRLELLQKNIKLELFQILQQKATLVKKVGLARQQWEKSIKFREKNLITESELVSKHDYYLTVKSSLNLLIQLHIGKETEQNNINKQIEQTPLKKEESLQEIYSNLSILDEKLIELEGSKSYSIKAPIDGIVTSLNAHQGQNISLNSSILTIIPSNTKLYAELYLPSRAIGFINKGQQVKIRYDAFPYQRFGLYQGTINKVAMAVINPNELDIPIESIEPIYRVQVKLDSQFINAYGKPVSLQSGMSLVADIIIEKRSLVQWLLSPIYGLKQ